MILGGNRHIQKCGGGHSTDRGHRLQTKLFNLHSFSEVHGSNNNQRFLKLFNCIKRKWGICVSRAKSQDTFLSGLGIWAKFTDEVSDISLNTGKHRYCDKDNCNSNK